jgi:hypothetical protein
LEKTNDLGLTITKMESADAVAPIAERNWTLNYLRTDEAMPAMFQFPAAKLPTSELAYKAYADADLIDVQESLPLTGLPVQPAQATRWILPGVLFIGCVAGLFLLLRPKKTDPAAARAAYTLPPQLTPFTVLNLLRRMEQDQRLGMPGDRRSELAMAIRQLEERYFGRTGETNGQSDLERLAREWVSRAS